MKPSTIQGPSTRHVHNAYEVLQDYIFNQTGVHCSVLVKPECVSIRTKLYSDYIQAKKAIKGRTSVDIVWARIET